MAITTAKTAYKKVVKEAEKIKNADPATIETMSLGDTMRQGDIYITRIDASKLKIKPIASRQLAPGETQGSRHIAVGDCTIGEADAAKVTAILNKLIPATNGQTLFIGPIIRATGPVTIEHPEHGHRTLPGESDYAVVYQRTWANEIRQTID